MLLMVFSSVAVQGMRLFYRPSALVELDDSLAAIFSLPVPVVVWFTQAFPVALIPEQLQVALVRLHVVDHLGLLHDTHCHAA
jgi:hypothetical protein